MIDFFSGFNAVFPIFFLVLTGIFLKKIKLINDRFVADSSKLIFRVILPCLMFRAMVHADLNHIFDPVVVIILAGGILFTSGLAYFIAHIIGLKPPRAGSFIQGSFRSNAAIIGLQIILTVFGESALAVPVVLLAFLTPLFNVLSVIVLTERSEKMSMQSMFYLIRRIFSNPIIIGVLAGIPFPLMNIPLPGIIDSVLAHLSGIALPMALLGVGASMRFDHFRSHAREAVLASTIKLIVMPVLITLLARFLGYHGQILGVIFILAGAPTAIVSFTMSQTLDGDHHLAADIITITTLFSVITISAGLFVLRFLHWL